jgi:ABC-type phosphate/phosphonate transport system permease subunit
MPSVPSFFYDYSVYVQLTADAVNKISTKIQNFIVEGGGAQSSCLSQMLKTFIMALVGVTVAFIKLEVNANW